MRNATVDKWLASFETPSQAEIQLGLTRIKTVAQRLDLLSPNAVVITVAGTNGKGSTVALLETLYHEAGYSVGAYTSPHLIQFNERIRVNKQWINDAALCHAFACIEAARGSIYLTYFEWTTLAAFLYFKTCQLDVIILEVGLGGRLDATNIIDANLAIITTIDFDHQDYLGHTIEAIAAEKAGIMRSGQPVIYADTPVPLSIVSRAQSLQTTLLCWDRDYSGQLSKEGLEVILPNQELLVLPTPQIHCHAAVAGVIAAHSLMELLPVSLSCIQLAIKNTHIHGRQQFIYGTIGKIFDVSHNPQAVRLLSQRLSSLEVKGKIHAIFSGLIDKDLYGLIKPMQHIIDYWYIAALDNKRAAPVPKLLASFEQVGLSPAVYDSIFEAYLAAEACAVAGDWIVVYGSFFVVGPIVTETGLLSCLN